MGFRALRTWVVVQNYGPFLGTLNIRFRIIIRTQRGTIILTTTHPHGLGEVPVRRTKTLVYLGFNAGSRVE